MSASLRAISAFERVEVHCEDVSVALDSERKETSSNVADAEHRLDKAGKSLAHRAQR